MMALPEIVRRVGVIDRTRIVYIEEYVLQYLQTYTCRKEWNNERIGLYGKYEKREEVSIYIIYAACPETDEYRQQMQDEPVEKIGYLYRKDSIAIYHGREEAGGTGSRGMLTGYYIFYDVNERMKDYLGQFYADELMPIAKKRERHMETEPAELTAADCDTSGQAPLLYKWLRIAAVCIIIVICTIAVATINRYDRMEDFARIMMQTSGWTQEQP